MPIVKFEAFESELLERIVGLIPLSRYPVIMRILMSIFLIVVGVLAIISGEADDSPGLQGIGLILILSVIFSIYRSRRIK